MDNFLSSRIKELVRYYHPDNPKIVEDLLHSFCRKLQLRESSSGYDRICMAILKVGEGSKENIEGAIQLGELDWRDLLVKAGFAHTVDAHKIWADTLIPGLYS